jgi:hypothetical protein
LFCKNKKKTLEKFKLSFDKMMKRLTNQPNETKSSYSRKVAPVSRTSPGRPGLITVFEQEAVANAPWLVSKN